MGWENLDVGLFPCNIFFGPASFVYPIYVMKKLYTILFTLIGTVFFCFSAYATHHSGSRGFIECRKIVNGVNFSVDPRIELFHTIEVISGMPLVNYIDLDYKQKIAARFENFRNHPLFEFIRHRPIYGKIFRSIDAPISFLLHLNNELEWRKDIGLQDVRTGTLDSLRMLMKDFAEAADYKTFFNNNQDLYQISLSTMVYNLKDFDEKNRLLRYCGDGKQRNISFNVILNFLGWGNFGPRFFKQNGAEMYAVIAPEKSAIRVPTFNLSTLYRLVWHEFAHSFANPAVEKMQNRFDELEYLWEPVKEPMKSQAYHTWQSVVKEHLTEAIACRLAAEKFGEGAAEINFVRTEKSKQWIYLETIINALKDYESNRDEYPSLDSFMPRIFDALKAIKPDQIKQWQTEVQTMGNPGVSAIPNVSAIYNSKNILIILSSAEVDLKADSALKAFVNKFRSLVPALQNARIVADTTALKMDLSGYGLSVWGTPQGNKFLAKYISGIPILIEKDRVLAENIYLGSGHGILIGWVNPFNEEFPMAVYTGQNPRDVVGFNSIMNGSGNYHIFRNFITLRQGSFVRNGKVWISR